MSTLQTRCPQCGALLRDDAAWCTLCHADLRPPPPAPEPAPVQLPDAALPAVAPSTQIDPLTAPFDQIVAAALADEAAAEAARAAAEAAAAVPVADLTPHPVPDQARPAEPRPDGLEGIDDPEVMFALLRGEGQDPILSRFGGVVSTPGSRAMVMIGGTAVLTVVLFGVITLLGFVFG